MKKKLSFCGTHSTGKTTLVEKVLEKYPGFNTPPKFNRVMNGGMPGWPINEEATFLSQYSTCAFVAWSYLVTKNMMVDRSIIDSFAYAAVSKNVSYKQLWRITNDFKDVLNDDFIHIYIPIEFDVVQDGFRSEDEKYRKEVDKYVKNYLDKNKIKYYTVTGTVEERMEQVEKIIEKYS